MSAKAEAAKPTSSCKSPSKPARQPTGQAQRPHDLLRISCHVMPFPPHSCMNRHQSGKPGPAALQVNLKNNQQIMLHAALATMKY